MGCFHGHPDIVAKTCLQTVPVQAAAALGRPGCTVQGLDRLPHFPSSVKLFGGYIDHIRKTHNHGLVEEYAYNGFSAPKPGAWTGRIVPHLSYLKNYQYIDQNHQSYHYEMGCADSQPRNWDTDKDGPWKPRWQCEWDFRATSLSYPDDSTASIHQALEGIIQACLNMIVFECPTRPRTASTSVVENFVIGLREFVENELGRGLPDFQDNSLNRSF